MMCGTWQIVSTLFTIVGVDDEVERPSVVLRNDRPLRPRREPGAAETAEVRLLDLLDDRRGVQGLRLRPGRVAAGRAVRLERMGVRAVEVAHEELLGGHRSLSRMRSTFSGVRSNS